MGCVVGSDRPAAGTDATSRKPCLSDWLLFLPRPMGSMFLGNELSSTISSFALRRGGNGLDAFLDGEYCWRLVEFVSIGAHSHRNNIHLAVFGCFLLVWAEWFQTVSRSRSAFLDEETKLCVWGILESGIFPDWALRIPLLVFGLGVAREDVDFFLRSFSKSRRWSGDSILWDRIHPGCVWL